MDFQRYLLIAAIAVLSFMLLTEWVEFKQERNGTDVVAAYEQQTHSNGNTTDAAVASADPAVPQDPAQAQAAHDLPSLETTDTPTPPVANQQPSVHVITDALEMEINLRGGDIEFAALPKYPAKIDTPDIPFTLLEKNERRTYVAQSGLIGPDGIDTNKGRALYSTSADTFRMADDQDQLVVDLHYRESGAVTITKRFTFTRGEYLVEVDYLIDNQSDEAWTGNLFGQLKRDNTQDPSKDSSGMGMSPYLGAAIHLPDEPYKKIKFGDIADNKFAKQSIEGGWIAMVQHYFTSAWIPDPDQTHTYSTALARDKSNIIRFTSPAVTVQPGEQGTIKSQLYTGPKDQYRLEEISPGLELTVDYGWLWWIAQPLFWLLTKLHGYLGNWGFAIIAVTVLVKAVFFGLNAKAYKSMANMRKVQPKLMEIRERYADDRQKQSQEMMNLYKKEKINPLGGCLPILVQMPVFISLYWVLMESVELRQAPFIGYIKDLSVMDPYFILPLIMGASMFIQQKLNPPPPDPMQAKIMQWMPIVFTFFFLFFPAGLVLYWVVNNSLSIIQQYIITKRIENA